MSTTRLCVRISNCSRESLSMKGLRITVSLAISVGSGMGPAVRALARRAVSMILSAAWSSTRWSYALSRIRIFCATLLALFPSSLLLDDFRGGAGAYGLAAFADGEPEAGLDRDGLTEGDIHLDVVTRHDHLDAFGQLDLARDVGGAHVELRAVASQERRVAPTLFLAQDVNLGLELGVGLDGAGLCKHLAAYDVFALDAAEQHTDVVAGLALL